MYLKAKYNVILVMANEGPTHYLSWRKPTFLLSFNHHKVCGIIWDINHLYIVCKVFYLIILIKTYDVIVDLYCTPIISLFCNLITHYDSSHYCIVGTKRVFSYIDLFSRPFTDYDYESLPLSEVCPPTFDKSGDYKHVLHHSMNDGLSSRENLTVLAKLILKQVQASTKVSGTKGTIIMFDTINSIFDSLDASQLEINEFLQSICDIWEVARMIKLKEAPKPQKKKIDYDDYYDHSDDDDDAAMAARRGGSKKQAVVETSKETGNFCLL